MTIHFCCPSCGDSHRSRLTAPDRAAFCELVIENHTERCPLTREEVHLTHWEMCWKDESPAEQSWQRQKSRLTLLRVESNRKSQPRSVFPRLMGIR